MGLELENSYSGETITQQDPSIRDSPSLTQHLESANLWLRPPVNLECMISRQHAQPPSQIIALGVSSQF